MARRCQHPFIFPNAVIQLGDRIYIAAAACHILPRQTDICFLIFAFAGSFFVVHACCLWSRFGPRGHYSLWGCQAGHGRATGILHDWSSAAEPLTRSDESFHSRAGRTRYRAQRTVSSHLSGVSSTFTGTCSVSVCLLAEHSMPVDNDHNNKAHALRLCPPRVLPSLTVAPLDSSVSHDRVSVVSSIIFAHHEAISKQNPPPGLSHHARPPRDRPTARPTTHRWLLWTLHITGRTRTTKHSTAQHSTAHKLDRHEGGAVAAVPAAPNSAE